MTTSQPLGSWHGASARKLAGRRCLSQLLLCLLFFVGTLLLAFDALWLKYTALVLLVGGGFYICFRNGERLGERDCAFAEGLSEACAAGTASVADQDRCFHPLKGFFAQFLGTLPFLILCILLAILTKRQNYTLGVLPSWVDDLMQQQEFSDALSIYNVKQSMGFVQILRVIVRAMLLPFFNVAAVYGNDAALLAERLSPLLMLLTSVGFGFGYANGQKLRNKVNESIRLGTEKKLKKQNRERKKRVRQPKEPERLI